MLPVEYSRVQVLVEPSDVVLNNGYNITVEEGDSYPVICQSVHMVVVTDGDVDVSRVLDVSPQPELIWTVIIPVRHKSGWDNVGA